ncbi:metallophosphoesterase family protein [Thermosipho atlanticus]|uniref:Calcineurin-like phosphoesterase n=1 Tax=Thermosipho atlanticus DSM 15807 TaxID=1123380 RepID=A0A1M5TLP3_9BACT|nr:metallophosphoesterase [Thermosipho atlanticus]SHH51677.1 Calcineurin-like phosphoesterase [Thermosipho atlanticus DSM 15807]
MKKVFFTIFLLLFIISAFKVSRPFIEKKHDNNLIYNNLMKIKMTSEDFTFVVLGDNKNSVSTFEKIISKINNDPTVKFVINTGDMVFDGNPIKYDFFLKQIKKFKVPLLVVPGNHDISDNGYENYINFFGPLYYSFSIKNSYFIILNNANQTEVDPYQMLWLEKNLNFSQQYKYRFVFMHVPLFDPRFEQQPGHSMKNLKNANKLLDLFKKYKVTMLFFGHIHGFFEGNWDGVPYLITGGAGAELVGTDPNHYFYHYIKVHVSSKGVSYKIIKMNSPDFNFIDRVGAFIWLYIYSFIVINYWVLVLIITSFSLGFFILTSDSFLLFVKNSFKNFSKLTFVNLIISFFKKFKKTK